MKCLDCGHTIETRRENYRYDASGLPGIVLHGVQVSRCPQCGAEEVAIPRIEELHRVIARALIEKPTRLAAPEIRYLRKYLGWSGTEFARYMGTARETVSRWENGSTQMGPAADRLLRVLVASREPVMDYSPEALARIEEGPTAPQPVKLGLSVGRKGWHARAA